MESETEVASKSAQQLSSWIRDSFLGKWIWLEVNHTLQIEPLNFIVDLVAFYNGLCVIELLHIQYHQFLVNSNLIQYSGVNNFFKFLQHINYFAVTNRDMENRREVTSKQAEMLSSRNRFSFRSQMDVFRGRSRGQSTIFFKSQSYQYSRVTNFFKVLQNTNYCVICNCWNCFHFSRCKSFREVHLFSFVLLKKRAV